MESETLGKIGAAIDDYLNSGSHFLRPLQQNVLRDISDDISKGNTHGHIRFPTGGGKGIMIGSEVEALLKAEEAGKLDLGDRKVLVLTPRKLLVDDLHQRFAESGMFGDIPDGVIGQRHGDLTESEKQAALEKPVLVTTYDSYRNLIETGELQTDSFPIVLLDEVHRTRGEHTSKLIREVAESAYVQGWTATDRYENGKHVGQELFGRDDPIHATGFSTAVEEGVLCPVINHVVRTNIDVGIGDNRANKDYLPEELNKIVGHHARDKMAVEMLANYDDPNTGVAFKDQDSVFYCVGVEHARQMAEKLNEKFGDGYAAMVSGDTPKAELAEIMRRYEDPNDPLKALANADLLIEGWDAPNASLCFMLRPTKSPILAEQTGGRVMRLDPNNPDKVAFVITFWDENMPDMVAFGDVIGGHHLGIDEARKPKEPREAKEGDGQPPKWMREDIDLSGMEITTDIREIANFAEGIRTEARKDIAGQKPDEQWLSGGNMIKFLMSTGVPEGRAAIEVLLSELAAKYEEVADGVGSGPLEIEHRGQTFQVANFMAGGGVYAHFHEADTDKFRKALGLSEMMPEAGWITIPELRAQLGDQYDAKELKPNGAVTQVIGSMMADASKAMGDEGLKHGIVGVEQDGQSLHVGKFGIPGSKRGVHTMAFAVHEADVAAIEALIDRKLGVERERDEPSEPSWAARVTENMDRRRSIHPDSDHITRRGSSSDIGIS